jgi:hypothetical protein
MVFLQPLIAEHTFRTLGHHYLSGQSAEYIARYKATYASSLAADLASIFSPEIQYHNLLHWISPNRARQVLEAASDQGRIPETLILRASAAPAGFAVITTGVAVLEAMRSDGYLDELVRASKIDYELIDRVARMIKADPCRFHKFPQAYNKPPLPDELKDQLNRAKKEMTVVAAVLQGYIDAVYKNAALGRAKALMKVADENPSLRKKAQKFFKSKSKKDVVKLTDLFTASEQNHERPLAHHSGSTFGSEDPHG